MEMHCPHLAWHTLWPYDSDLSPDSLAVSSEVALSCPVEETSHLVLLNVRTACRLARPMICMALATVWRQIHLRDNRYLGMNQGMPWGWAAGLKNAFKCLCVRQQDSQVLARLHSCETQRAFHHSKRAGSALASAAAGGNRRWLSAAIDFHLCVNTREYIYQRKKEIVFLRAKVGF